MARASELAFQNLQEGLENSSPLPESFEDAVDVACEAAREAIAAGQLQQMMLYRMGDADADDEEGVLAFVGRLAQMLALQGAVRVVCCEQETLEECRSRWGPLPSTLQLKSLGQTSIGEPALTLAISPSAADLAVLVSEAGDAPLILVNADLPLEEQRASNFAGSTIFLPFQNATKGIQAELTVPGALELVDGLSPTPTFHMELVETEEDLSLNEAFIVRAWPRPFSVWEDAGEEDPRAVDGFVLLDLIAGDCAPMVEDVRTMLAVSRDGLTQRRKDDKKAEMAYRYKDANKWADGFNP